MTHNDSRTTKDEIEKALKIADSEFASNPSHSVSKVLAAAYRALEKELSEAHDTINSLEIRLGLLQGIEKELVEAKKAYTHEALQVIPLKDRAEKAEAAIADAEGRVRQLEAACILGDAYIEIAKKGVIKENEVLLPFLELRSRAEKSEAENAELRERIESLNGSLEEWKADFKALEAENIALAETIKKKDKILNVVQAARAGKCRNDPDGEMSRLLSHLDAEQT